MAYEYREVKCPWCDHIFMWNKTLANEWGGLGYKVNETNEHVMDTRCPKCDMTMIVLENVLEGIDTSDSRVTKIEGFFERYQYGG